MKQSSKKEFTSAIFITDLNLFLGDIIGGVTVAIMVS